MSTESLEVGPIADFAPDSARRVDINGHRVAIVRIGDDVYAIGDRCSHADYSLAEGAIDADDKTIECWKHGSSFSLETGEPTCFPATRPVPVYDARVENDTITVDITTDINVDVTTDSEA